MARVDNINSRVLRQCREQLDLPLDAVKSRVPGIAEMERGRQAPTFRQLDALAELYHVPRWVFVSDSLPRQYQFKSVPSFRKFSDAQSPAFGDPRVRALLARVERLRNLILEWRKDAKEPIPEFQCPEPQLDDIAATADAAREWMGTAGPLEFAGWKAVLEDKGIFIFMSGKYSGWSKIETEFRGLSISSDRLPTIIINDSDARSAQSFTLMHELGHLLRRETVIDSMSHSDSGVENWCDEFAGTVLMPAAAMHEAAAGQPPDSPPSLEQVNKIARSFRVSPFACTIRMRQLRMIGRGDYDILESEILAQWAKNREAMKDKGGGPSRDRAKEILGQYGRIFSKTVLQAYLDNEISLHKACKIFGLKQASHVLAMQDLL